MYLKRDNGYDESAWGMPMFWAWVSTLCS